MLLFVKAFLKFMAVIIIQELAFLSFAPMIGGIISCISYSYITFSIYKSYKESKPERKEKSLALKKHMLMFVFTCILYVSYSTAANGFEWYFIPDNYENVYSLRIIDLIVATTFTPVIEELMFRGILLNQINKKMKFCTANIIQALVFSLFHIDLRLFVFFFVAGLTIGAIYKYFNVYYAMLFHALNNIISLIMMINPIKISIISDSMILLISIVFSIITFLLMLAMMKYSTICINHANIQEEQT